MALFLAWHFLGHTRFIDLSRAVRWCLPWTCRRRQDKISGNHFIPGIISGNIKQIGCFSLLKIEETEQDRSVCGIGVVDRDISPICHAFAFLFCSHARPQFSPPVFPFFCLPPNMARIWVGQFHVDPDTPRVVWQGSSAAASSQRLDKQPDSPMADLGPRSLERDADVDGSSDEVMRRGHAGGIRHPRFVGRGSTDRGSAGGGSRRGFLCTFGSGRFWTGRTADSAPWAVSGRRAGGQTCRACLPIHTSLMQLLLQTPNPAQIISVSAPLRIAPLGRKRRKKPTRHHPMGGLTLIGLVQYQQSPPPLFGPPPFPLPSHPHPVGRH